MVIVIPQDLRQRCPSKWPLYRLYMGVILTTS